MNKAILWFIIIGVFGSGLFAGVMYITFNKVDRFFGTGSYGENIRQNGLEGEARIISIDDAVLFGGVSFNEMEYLEIKMEVNDGLNPPYIIAIDTTIPDNIIINKEDVLPVRVNPDNERGVVYDYERGNIKKIN